MIKIYGIKNCDTMKKAFKWLDENNIAYDFYDYKKQGADSSVLSTAIAQHSWEAVINRRGTTWRKLPENTKETMDNQSAIAAAQDNPSLIKRPLITHGDTIILGFNADDYAATFKGAA